MEADSPSRDDDDRPQALVGWKLAGLPSGCLMVLQVARSQSEYEQNKMKHYNIAMTTNQIRLLGEFLVKVANDLEGKTTKKARWWTL
jgi:hypothetical protein